MAIDAILMGSGAKSNASNTITSDSATTTNGTSKFLVGVTWDASATITGGVPSDSKGNTWVAVGSERTVNGGKQRWFITTTKLGGSSHTITVAFSTTAYPTISCFEITSAGAVDIAVDALDTGGMPITMASGTFADQPQVLLALVSNYTGSDGAYTVNASTPTGTLMTSQSDMTNYWAHGTAKYAITATTSFSPTLNRTNSGGGDSNIHLVSIRQAAGGAAYSLTCASGTYTVTGRAANFGSTVPLASGTYTLTGRAALLNKGFKLTAAAGTYTVVGADATADYGITLAAGSYIVTGQAAALRAARKLLLAAGTYGVTGNSAGLLRGYPLVAAAGTYAITGQAATLRAARTLLLQSGAYSITGRDVGLLKGFTMLAAGGTYAVTGQDIALRVFRLLALASGAYALTGRDATLIYGTASPSLQAASGTYTVTGTAAGLAAARRLALAAGAYSVSGQALAVRAARLLALGAGSYTLTGRDAGFLVPWRLTAESGSYALTGMAVTLNYSGAVSPPPPPPPPAPLPSGGGGGARPRRPSWARQPGQRPMPEEPPRPPVREPDRLEVLRREDAALLVMLRGLYRDGVFAPTDDEPPTPEDSTP